MLLLRNKDEVSRDSLAEVDLMIFGGSSERFDDQELNELKGWLNAGGRALFMFSEGDAGSSTNLNQLLAE